MKVGKAPPVPYPDRQIAFLAEPPKKPPVKRAPVQPQQAPPTATAAAASTLAPSSSAASSSEPVVATTSAGPSSTPAPEDTAPEPAAGSADTAGPLAEQQAPGRADQRLKRLSVPTSSSWRRSSWYRGAPHRPRVDRRHLGGRRTPGG